MIKIVFFIHLFTFLYTSAVAVNYLCRGVLRNRRCVLWPFHRCQYDKEDYSCPYRVRNAGNTSRKMIGQFCA